MWFIFLLMFLGGMTLAVFLSVKVEQHAIHVHVARAFPGIALSILGLLLWMSFTQVPAGTMGVVTRWGKVTGTLTPGAHFITPFAESASNLSTQTLTVKPSEDAASHDLQVVHVEVTLAYHFDPQHVDYIYSQLSDSTPNSVENKVVIPAILEAIKARVAQYDAQQLISRRPEVRDGIETYVTDRLKPYHIIPETTSITNFSFSPDYEKSIEAKVTASQLAEKAQNDLQRVKIEAEQKIAAAEGEAKALAAQKQQVTPELIQLRQVEVQSHMIDLLWAKWDGKLPETYFGGSAPLATMEMFKKMQQEQVVQKK